MEKREIDLTVSCYGKVKDVKYDAAQRTQQPFFPQP